MANYIEELDQLAAQNESNPGGPFDTQPIEGQILAGARVAPVQQPAAAPYIGYGDPSTEGLPRMMSTDRVAFDPALAVQQGAQQMAGTVTPAQQEAPVAQGAAPAEERAPRQRGGVTWSAPGTTEAFTQEDFYPNPQDPAQYNYSTGLEVVARPGRMPMGAISKAATILNNRQVELDKKRQAFAAEFSKVPKTADPYQQNFTRLVQERNNEFVQGIADAMYGGNVNKAYRAIATNPELQARWRDMNAKNEALAAHGLYNFKRAEDYLTKAATNKIASTPEARQLAKDILYGMGRYAGGGGVGGNFDKLVNDMTQFDMMLGRDEYFKDVVAPSVDKFAKQISLSVDETGKPLMVYDKGRYVFFTEGSKKSFDTQIEQFAKDMAISQGYGSGESLEQKVADNVEYLKNMLPSQVETRTQMIDKYRGLGGGGGDGTKKGIRLSKTEQNLAYDDSSINVTRSKISQFVGGNPVELSKPWTMTSGGKNIPMLPKYIERRPDGLYISGDSYVDSQTGLVASDADIEIALNMGAGGTVKLKSSDGTTEKTLVRKPVSAPIKGNEGTVESMLEGTDYSAVFGSSAPAQTTPGSWSSRDAMTAKYTINGKEYTAEELMGMGYNESDVQQYRNR